MELLQKKKRFDLKMLMSEPGLFYGKIVALTVGAFFLGRYTNRSPY